MSLLLSSNSGDFEYPFQKVEEEEEERKGGDEMSKEEKSEKCGRKPMPLELKNYPQRCFEFFSNCDIASLAPTH